MNTVIEKSDEQIAKDKEAVARMVGAKAAMEAAQRRIELLESRLRSVREDCAYVAKALGDAAHFRIYHMNDWRVRPAKEIFNDIDNTIKAVL
jgi:predicted phosphoadenosine phosphosulfate sulfurtransferase